MEDFDFKKYNEQFSKSRNLFEVIENFNKQIYGFETTYERVFREEGKVPVFEFDEFGLKHLLRYERFEDYK